MTDVIKNKNRLIGIVIGLIAVALLAVGIVSAVYSGKVYPGVRVNGVSMGGATEETARKILETQSSEYRTELLPIEYGVTAIRLPLGQMNVTYSDAAIAEALRVGRRGNPFQQVGERLSLILGKPAIITGLGIDNAKLKPYLDQIEEGVVRSANNARLDFSSGSVSIDPSQSGTRLDRGLLTLLIKDQIAAMETSSIIAPVYDIKPAITEEMLETAKDKVNVYVEEPLHLEAQGKKAEVDLPTIVSWVSAGQVVAQTQLREGLKNFYATESAGDISVSIDKAKVLGYVATFAAKVDQKGQDAALNISDGKATVFRPSRDGIELLRDQAVADIVDALSRSNSNRNLALKTKLTKPSVHEENLNDLGIKELLSEGVSFFPGSPPERMQNVRVGQSKYNGIILKPGEIFSFGKILGDVGPETGYAPAKVIIGNRQELQYGGGLCQVSSTAFRAALNAGLPIVERVNHSFAVSYYTAPYGVPGVDATIYYPQVDFKFKNDTANHILIQTIMQGTTLKFQFYGTKEKEGRIRGPQFVSGSSNAEEPSKTVFWRDVLDLSGNVIKTDTFNTSYKSSKDFPNKPQFQ